MPFNAPGLNSARTSKSLSPGRKSSRRAEPNKLSLRMPRERQKSSKACRSKFIGKLKRCIRKCLSFKKGFDFTTFFATQSSYPPPSTSMSRRNCIARKAIAPERCYIAKKRFKEPHAYPNNLSKSLCDPTQNQWISSPFLRPTARYFAEILTDQMSFVPDNFLKRREG